MNDLRSSNFLRPFFGNAPTFRKENSELGTNLGPIPFFIFKQFWTEKLGAFENLEVVYHIQAQPLLFFLIPKLTSNCFRCAQQTKKLAFFRN